MEKHVKGALALFVLGVVTLVGGYFALPIIQEMQQKSTSDAAGDKGSITIGMDNFAGYFPLCSPVMKSRMLSSGYLIKCEDDKADYDQRMSNLKKGDIDFAVATVDSYLLTGARYDFPGTIIAIIDESSGGDAIIAAEDEIDNIDAMKNYPNLKIAVTPDSPSDHLLKAVSAHFDIPRLKERKGDWRVAADGSTAALDKLISGEANVAVLWEPDVSKALSKPGYKKILGTEQTTKLIVDILLVNRKYSEDHPEVVDLLLSHYFRALKTYTKDRDKFTKDLAAYAGTDTKQTEAMLKGIKWIGLYENATGWFGIRQPGQLTTYGLFDTIDATMQILIEYGDFDKNPVPGDDPRRITYSKPVSTLYARGIAGKITTSPGKAVTSQQNSLTRDFPPLSEKEWNGLKEVGTLKVRPIVFQRGSSRLSLDGKSEVDKAVSSLKSYPNFRVEIEGHTNPRGDKAANKDLSQNRAEAVAQYLMVTYNIDADRVRAIGLGSERMLAKEPGEAQRGYYDRLSRVELHLKVEIY